MPAPDHTADGEEPASALFRRYAAQRRTLAPPGFRLETPPGLTRLLPLRPDLDGTVMFAELAAETCDAAIAAESARFAALGCGLEWKVHAFDTPADLPARLQRHGFAPDDTEAFMVYPLAAHRPRPRRAGVAIEHVTTPAAIAAVVAVQEEVWRLSLPWLADALAAALPTTSIFLAIADGAPVGTGWIDWIAGSDFADLHGGAVLPAWRGRGIYSALFDVRADEARTRGLPWLAVDAAPMSRPILERRGFRFICETTPWRRPAVTAAATTSAPGATSRL